MMTRKDYIATADILDTLVATATDESMPNILDAIDEFAEMFKADNERFNRTRFLNACGVYEKQVIDRLVDRLYTDLSTGPGPPLSNRYKNKLRLS